MAQRKQSNIARLITRRYNAGSIAMTADRFGAFRAAASHGFLAGAGSLLLAFFASAPFLDQVRHRPIFRGIIAAVDVDARLWKRVE